MNMFSIPPQGVVSIQRKLLRNIILLDAFLLAGLVAWQLNGLFTAEPVNQSSVSLVGIVSIMVMLQLFLLWRKTRKRFSSYRLTITDDAIIREMQGYTTFTMLKSNVSQINKTNKGAYAIIGDSKLNAIGIPEQIDRPEQLEELLSAIRPIVVAPVSPWTRYIVPITLIVPVALGYLILNGDPILELCGLGGTIILLVWGFWIIQKSVLIDRLTKRLSYVVIIPILSFIAMFVSNLLDIIG